MGLLALRKARERQQWGLENEEMVKFEKQLASLGLVLKDVKGDGNCLFRALGDQLNGDGQNHMEYRRVTVKYIRDNRDDFEPFMEEDMGKGFDDYTSQLEKDGTYAGHWFLSASASALLFSY